ncbi:MAG: WD40/YVTN/BNR-like repeat-containing protein, partial [Gemmataceae bacterium]
MKIVLSFLCLFASVCSIAQQIVSPLEASFKSYQEMKNATPYRLDWVSLGPTLNSARADVVQVDTKHPGTMYVGFGSGGLWKTINNGIHWQCVFQEQASLGIGDMELAPSNPDIIYVGTGENLKKPRNFTLPGTGMYRSNDAGKTWQHIGLDDSWAIAEIAIHPKNPDIVMVAVLGHLWSKNENRGLYQTTNGGKTWQKVLYKDDKTGANDVVIAPTNPKIMYASTWEVYPGISGKNSGV